MSYDVYLECDRCGTDWYWSYYTSNCAPMWRRAGCDLIAFQGRPAAELGAALDWAIESMEDDPETYRAMNPENGWGDYDSCLQFLRDLRDGCHREPVAQVAVHH